jgi:hypothetical protein
MRVGLVLLLAMTACRAPAPEAPEVDLPLTHSAETAEMAARLLRRAQTVNPTTNRFANTARLEALRRVPLPADVGPRVAIEVSRAEQTLYVGRFDEAIVAFQAILVEMDRMRAEQGEVAVPRDAEYAVLEFLASAYLRRAERTGCVDAQRMSSCAVPVPREDALDDPADARIAAELYQRLLVMEPEGLGPLWSLNVAHMMIGDYPEGVPEQWRIPERVFESPVEFPRFRDIAPDVGLDITGNVGGAVMDDFDGDLDFDVMVSSWSVDDPLAYWRNDGGRFVDASEAAGVLGLLGGGNLVHADYDNDGDLDVFVLRGGWLDERWPNSLLRNRGDGTFEDVTASAGLLDPQHPSQTAAWADFDRDGWLDLFVGNETFGNEPHPTQLFMSNRDGTFTDAAARLGASEGGIVKGVVAGDYDGDGFPDIYVSRTGGRNTLLRNRGVRDGRLAGFEDATARAGVAEPEYAFPAWFWDFDNDGLQDLFVAGYRTRYGDVAAEYLGLPHQSELPRTYRGTGDGTFEDVTTDSGADIILFAMGANFGDLNADGWPDVFIGTGDAYFQAVMPDRVLLNIGGRSFVEVTGPGGFGMIAKGHGVAFADFDHDGDEDVLQTLGGAYEGDLGRVVLFENPGFGHRWVTFLLEGVVSNRSAIGAHVRVSVETPAGPRDIHETVGSGGSFGANTLRAEMGLGDAERVTRVTVTWPLGRVDTFEDIELDRAYRLREGEAARPLTLPPIARTSTSGR